MGLFDQIGDALGGEGLQKFLGGTANFDDPNSEDHRQFEGMIRNANQADLQQVFEQSAHKVNSDEYAQQMSSGNAAFSTLGKGGLNTIASTIIRYLSGAGQNSTSLLSRVPGLRTDVPEEMDAAQVSALAQYTQKNHPGVFGQVAAHLGKLDPGLLKSFLGSGAMKAAASGLAQRFLHQ